MIFKWWCKFGWVLNAKDELSGAKDIKAICTEAGLLALRERRMKKKNINFINSNR